MQMLNAFQPSVLRGALAEPFVSWIETKSASGETRAAEYAIHSTKITHMPSHLTLPCSCGT